MSQKEIFDFPSFSGEHPYAGILLIPWNYSPCIIVAASWCLSHTTPITSQYFMNMSMQNPYKVIVGFVNTSLQDVKKCQIRLGIKAIIHPNPVVVFALIKVIPVFYRTSYVNYEQLKYNATVRVNEHCESAYWFLDKQQIDHNNNYVYKYLLMNQIPCPYELCHYSNTKMCSILKKPNKYGVSAMILCNYHLMSFAEFGHEDGRSVLYHTITNEVIDWIKQHVHTT